MTKPRILFIDLETLPNVVYNYSLWEGSKPDMIIQEKAIICFGYKWLGDKKTTVIEAEEPYDDYDLCVQMTEIMNEADYIVAHYGDKFDLRFIRSRCIINGIMAPAFIPSIDTYKLAKKHFNFNANRLDYLGKLLGFGGKITTGWSLWQKCAEGDKKAIKQMAEYNKRDVELLEKVFLHMLPHVESKLNYQLFSDKVVCPHCGSDHIQRRGTVCLKTRKRQRLACMKCGTWFTGKYEA
jgi:DNA polymerase III epsilon subunit-like protein